LISAGADFWYHGFPTFPQLRFLTFNIHQDLAVFYGVHRPDYYFTEGLPLLLMGLLPFTLFGLYRSAAISFQKHSSVSYSLETLVLPILTWTVLIKVIAMSLIRHKEARFIYPLLPCLHLIGGVSVFQFRRRASIWKGFILLVIVGIHYVIGSYASNVHQRGLLDVIHYLREQHEQAPVGKVTTVAFLMPCHSTPWRSHLIHDNIDAWALTCEPPVNMTPAERAEYVDEADVFYKDVPAWLDANMESLSLLEKSNINAQIKKSLQHEETTPNGQITGINRPWPQYLVFFEQLLPELVDYLSLGVYRVCDVFFNTKWHDDWRREGNVVVFCLLDSGHE
jgi:phosphatidylinositol glycan class B